VRAERVFRGSHVLLLGAFPLLRNAGVDTFVKQWNDGSGLGHNATQTTDGNQPTYIGGGLNGKPVLRFTQSSGSVMQLGDLSGSFPTAGSIFAVSTINTDGRYNLFGNRNNDERWVADTWTESRPGSFRVDAPAGTTTYASWPQTGSHVFSLESSSSTYRVLIDGTQTGSTGGNYHNGSGSSTHHDDAVQRPVCRYAAVGQSLGSVSMGRCTCGEHATPSDGATGCILVAADLVADGHAALGTRPRPLHRRRPEGDQG